jgi:hypothetical protein
MNGENVENMASRIIIIAHIARNVFHQTKNTLKTTTTTSFIKDL